MPQELMSATVLVSNYAEYKYIIVYLSVCVRVCVFACWGGPICHLMSEHKWLWGALLMEGV